MTIFMEEAIFLICIAFYIAENLLFIIAYFIIVIIMYIIRIFRKNTLWKKKKFFFRTKSYVKDKNTVLSLIMTR